MPLIKNFCCRLFFKYFYLMFLADMYNKLLHQRDLCWRFSSPGGADQNTLTLSVIPHPSFVNNTDYICYCLLLTKFASKLVHVLAYPWLCLSCRLVRWPTQPPWPARSYSWVYTAPWPWGPPSWRTSAPTSPSGSSPPTAGRSSPNGCLTSGWSYPAEESPWTGEEFGRFWAGSISFVTVLNSQVLVVTYKVFLLQPIFLGA